MRQFLSVYFVNIIQFTFIGVLAILIYGYFPGDGFTARTLATLLVASIFAGVAVWLIARPFPEYHHLIGALALGVIAGILIAKVGFGEGWESTLRAFGLISSWLAAAALVTEVTHRVETGHWKW